MNKEELVELLKELNIATNEGISSDENTNVLPKLVYWDYIWEVITASGSLYTDNVTYQVSFLAKTPRHPKLIELKNKLAAKKIYPTISHEYVAEDKTWHSFFAIEVLENV